MTRSQLMAWIWTAVILVACWIPGRYLKDLESGPSPDFPTDKVVHFTMFAGFAALWTRAGGGGWATFRVFLIGALLAVGTELGQGLRIVARDPDVLDVTADLAGLLLGVCVPPAFVHDTAREREECGTEITA